MKTPPSLAMGAFCFALMESACATASDERGGADREGDEGCGLGNGVVAELEVIQLHPAST